MSKAMEPHMRRIVGRNPLATAVVGAAPVSSLTHREAYAHDDTKLYLQARARFLFRDGIMSIVLAICTSHRTSSSQIWKLCEISMGYIDEGP